MNDDDSKWASPTMNRLILNDFHFRFRCFSNVEVVRQPAYPPSYAFAVIDSELIRQNHQKHFWQKFVALEHRHDHDSGNQLFVYFRSNRKCKSDQIQEKDLDEQGQGRNHHHHLNWVEYRYRPEGPNFFHKWLLEFASSKPVKKRVGKISFWQKKIHFLNFLTGCWSRIKLDPLWWSPPLAAATSESEAEEFGELVVRHSSLLLSVLAWYCLREANPIVGCFTLETIKIKPLFRETKIHSLISGNGNQF